jgi:hypothetical protein
MVYASYKTSYVCWLSIIRKFGNINKIRKLSILISSAFSWNLKGD